jgi:hypothetical protein
MSFQQPEWLRSGSSTKDKQHEEHGNTAGSSITGDVPREFSLSTYQFDLPQELIAQEPVSKRDESRLLCINRSTGQTAHHTFKDLPLFLHESDLLVLNETKVTPCALTGHKTTGGRVSLLVLDPVLSDQESLSGRAATRVCMAGSSKPLRSGMTIVLESSVELIVEKILVPGRVVIRFPVEETGFLNFLETHGTTPLPPYIKPGDKEQAFHRNDTRRSTPEARALLPHRPQGSISPSAYSQNWMRPVSVPPGLSSTWDRARSCRYDKTM